MMPDSTNLPAPEQKEEHSAAVQSEIATTQNADQKTELAEELFPHRLLRRGMRTRRVLH